MNIVQDGPRRPAEWGEDMKRVRDSAFGLPKLSVFERLSARRRFRAESDRYPVALTRHECWIVRAEVDGSLVGYAWGYQMAEPDRSVSIDDVGVHADHQGQGVGAAMIDEMVTWLRTGSVDRITGFATNEFMHRIFQRPAITSGL